MLKRNYLVPTCLLALLLAGCLPTLAADRTKPSARTLETYSGEVVLRSNESLVLVLVDEADRKGKTDGKVDHIFSFWAVPPVFLFDPISIREPKADVELREDGLRLVLHHHGEVIDFWLSGFDVGPWGKRYPSYTHRVFEDNVQLSRYSGESVSKLFLADAEQMELEQVRSEARIAAFIPPPDPESGGESCLLTCTKSCAGGSCSAVCNKGFCAKCTCLGEPPAIFPNCTCYLGTALGG